MIVVALEEDEMDLAGECSLLFVVLKVNLKERHSHLHLVARSKSFQLLFRDLPLGIKEHDFAVLEHLAFEIVVDMMLFLYHLNIFGFDEHAYSRPGCELMIVLHHELITVVGVDHHLVMHTLEDATLHHAVPFGEIAFWYSVFGVVVLLLLSDRCLFGVLPDVYIFGSDDHIYRCVLSEAGVHTVELLVAESYSAVAYHGGAEDIALAYEVRHEAVDGLVVDIGRSAYLLYLAFVHHHHAVRKGECLFLVVSNIDEGYS